MLNNLRLNPKILFNSEGITENLSGKSVRGGIITMGSTGILFVVNMAQTVILARLLTPEDYGIIGMVTVFIGIIALFKDAGLSTATVQKDKISKEQISSLFWINILISSVFGLLILANAPLVVWFYKKPELAGVTAALAFTFIIGGFQIQHNALIRRHMRFDLMAIKTIVSAITGLTVSILAAISGLKYWALILGSFTITLSDVLLTFFFCPWLPGKLQKGSGIRDMLKFGAHLTASSFANYFSRNADNMLIGKFIGATELGLYSKAYQIFMLPISNIRNPISQVAVPALSSLQNKPNQYKSYFYKISDILAAISFPIAVYLFFEADFIIKLVLGDQWTEAIPVFKLLALAGLIQAVASQRGLVMITTGQSRRFLNWSIFYAIIAVSSFVIGLPYGIEGVAGAYALAEYIVFIPSLFYCYRNSPINPLTFTKNLISPLFISFLAAVSLEGVKYFFNGESLVYHLVYLATFGIIYSGLTWLRKDFRETLLIFVREFKKKKK